MKAQKMTNKDYHKLQNDLDSEMEDQERPAGLQGEEEDWEEELTNERPDSSYLPGQQMAEFGSEMNNLKELSDDNTTPVEPPTVEKSEKANRKLPNPSTKDWQRKVTSKHPARQEHDSSGARP